MTDCSVPARLCLICLCVFIASCTSARSKDGPPSSPAAIRSLPPDPVPRPEPRSRYGNGPIYEVFGKRYTVMEESTGYRERGVASWYGKKFHGRLTASREPYDMYAMTAAHKSLPLPTYVRVRNLQNDRSVIVRVNDRGPFVSNRVIDLSYSAALKLDMVRDGTSLVEVEAIDFGAAPGDRPTRQTTLAPPDSLAAPPTPETSDSAAGRAGTARAGSAPAADNAVYAQTGAFSDRANADRQFMMLLNRGIKNALIYEDSSVEPVLYRVRVGPITNVVQYDVLVEELDNLGIPGEPYLVTD